MTAVQAVMIPRRVLIQIQIHPRPPHPRPHPHPRTARVKMKIQREKRKYRRSAFMRQKVVLFTSYSLQFTG